MDYSSTVTFDSEVCEGVRCTIRRMSYGRRLELVKLLRDAAARLEYHEASERLEDRLQARAIEAEIQRAYLEWGLVAVEGLEIDGASATAGLLFESGPEALCREVAGRIQSECFLDEQARKN